MYMVTNQIEHHGELRINTYLSKIKRCSYQKSTYFVDFRESFKTIQLCFVDIT